MQASTTSFARALLALTSTLLFGGTAFAQSAALDRAAKAMGATELKSLRYSGDGIGYTFGQAYKPGLPWPKIKLHSVTRTINYETGSMRDEVVLSRAEALGGGGYPHTGEQRNDQYLSGNLAWNQLATAPLPGPRFVAERTHQLWITPHGVLKAAQRNKASARTQRANGATSIAFTEPGRFAATVHINDASLVERVESRAPDPVLGDTAAVTTYSDYRDFGGIKFPTRIRQSQGGFPVLDLTVREVQPNAPADIQAPELVRAATERVTADKVVDGVWLLGGGSHNSVAIEMKDHLILVEAPLNEGRTGPVIDQARKLAPGKPIRYVINSHPHFDHSGGLRTAAGEGATIVTQSQNKAYFEKAFATPNAISPDRLAKSGKRPQFRGVDERLTLSDGARTLEIYHIQDSHHTDSFVMVYLPKEQLLIEADAYTPAAPNTPPPARPNPNHTNLIDNLERLKLSVDRIVPLHGRVVPVSELYTAAGRSPGKGS
jgi:glyoxylase-like metal-dependent hydrolase (beta-lactamase superfamily II)